MASYNHGTFVRKAIESVLSQSYQDLELVITDDGSSDGTVDVIRSVIDVRIKLHAFAGNQGACVSMNDAIARAQGEYIAVLNSDDYFLPGKLQRQIDYLDTHPEIGAVFGLPRLIDERGRPLEKSDHAFGRIFIAKNQSREDWLRHFFYIGNALCHPTVMLRKICYEKSGLFDPLLMQLPDLDMWVRICRGFEIYILPEELTAFRVLDREQNVSAPTKEKMARHAWEMSAILERYAQLPDSDLRAIFNLATEKAPRPEAKIVLSLAAIGLARPGYSQFGLALLQKCIRENPASFSLIEYFKLVGEVDPCSVNFSGLEYQILSRSKLWRAIKKILRNLLPRNRSR